MSLPISSSLNCGREMVEGLIRRDDSGELRWNGGTSVMHGTYEHLGAGSGPVEPTPVLYLDVDHVLATLERFRRSFPSVTLHYPVKCNSAPRLLRVLLEADCKFEVASLCEVEAVSSAGGGLGEVLFGNPVRARRQTRSAYEFGVRRFSVDSPGELRRLSDNARGAQVYARLATLSANTMVPSEGKFGVSPEDAVELLSQASSLGLDPYGISFHVGSQAMRPDAWVQPVRDAIRVLTELDKRGIRLSMFDIGGGFPASYGRPVPSLEEYGGLVTRLLDDLPYPMNVIAEPGRALVAEAGVLRCSVLDVVHRHGVWWVHTDLGVFNGMMEVLESGGKLRYPITDRRPGPRRICNVTGPTCDSQDTFAVNVELSKWLAEGDELLVGSAGAYTTVYASSFNGFPIPETVVVPTLHKNGQSAR